MGCHDRRWTAARVYLHSPDGLILAGLNVMVFYLTSFRRIATLICGRMLTFFRLSGCDAGEAVGFLAECIVR